MINIRAKNQEPRHKTIQSCNRKQKGFANAGRWFMFVFYNIVVFIFACVFGI